MTKKFALRADSIKPLVTRGGSCIASDMITVEGCPVGYLYREQPEHSQDSGWRFMAGQESQAYLDDAGNFGIYDVNTLANYDRDIIAYLGAPVGAAYERVSGMAGFVQVAGDAWQPGMPKVDPWPPPGYPLVEGDYSLTAAWRVNLPERFARRTEDRSLVLWRPGITIWLTVWDNPSNESRLELLTYFKGVASRERFSEQEVVEEAVTRYSYRLLDQNEDGTQESLYGFVFSDRGFIQMAIYFDDPADEAVARQFVERVVLRETGASA